MTTLDAVNQMLSAIGEAPVTTTQAGNPEIDLALLTLNQVTREVQAERWHFNREDSYPLTPDNAGEIAVPSDALFISVNRPETRQSMDLVVRQGKLYDKRSHSFTFTLGQAVPVDVVWAFDFEDLPAPFQLYIAQKAARVFVSRSQGSREMAQMAALDEDRLRANCIAYDTDEQDLTMATTSDGRNMQTFHPRDAIWRFSR